MRAIVKGYPDDDNQFVGVLPCVASGDIAFRKSYHGRLSVSVLV